MSVFDMGKNKADFSFPFDQRIRTTTYLDGRVEQFCHDLAVVGRAAMPDGEIVNWSPEPNPAFPRAPLQPVLDWRAVFLTEEPHDA